MLAYWGRQYVLGTQPYIGQFPDRTCLSASVVGGLVECSVWGEGCVTVGPGRVWGLHCFHGISEEG